MDWKDKFLDKVVCGDCLELMKELPDGCVDLVVTDPPYGVGKAKWDKLPVGALREAWRVCGRAMLVFWNAFDLERMPREIGVEPKNVCVWWKPNVAALYMFDRSRLSAQWEPVFYFSKNGGALAQHSTDVFAFNSNPRLHPTEKPLPLLRKLIWLFAGDLILDPFLGSGTTAIAAKQLGRHFIGMEIEPKYCEIAERRLSQEVLKL